MDLVWPAAQFLASYVRALEQGRSPGNIRPQASLEHLALIAKDPARFLEQQVDREAKGPPITLRFRIALNSIALRPGQ